MNVTIAIDSFKGSLTSMEAGMAAKDGILRVFPDATVQVCPLADGGEGTACALTQGMGGEWVSVTVTGPLGKPVACSYGILKDTNTAIIEMSAAAGITLVPDALRNPLYTTTYGVGEMILDAMDRGCRRFIVGIGGSATNDGGIGMLQALGFEFLNADEKPVSCGAAGLSELTKIRNTHVIPALSECTFLIACDVTNPLCGPQGCSHIYGPQKGADPEMILQMDQWLSDYALLTKKLCPKADPTVPGTGAAGGLGFAFLSYTNAVLESGIQIVLRETKLQDYLENCDFVITGEGRLDAQTVMGKAPIGVAKLAKKYKKPVLAFAGCISSDANICNTAGIDAYFPIVPEVLTSEEAMNKTNAAKNMSNAVEQAFRLIRLLN